MLQAHHKTVIFFDLDGTLMVNPFNRQIFPEVFAGLAAQTGRSADQWALEVFGENARRMADPDPANFPATMDWDDIIATVAAWHGATFQRGTLPPLVEKYAVPPYINTLDDAVSALRKLREPGHRWLVVASMGLSKYQNPVMKALGLYDCFDDFLMPDLNGYLKTDPRFYERYTASGRQLIHVGDNYIHDVKVPKQIGAHPVLRLPVRDEHFVALDPFKRPPLIGEYGAMIQFYPDSTHHADVLPDAVVVSLQELPSVVARLER